MRDLYKITTTRGAEAETTVLVLDMVLDMKNVAILLGLSL
jgi:hypothetical protein